MLEDIIGIGLIVAIIAFSIVMYIKNERLKRELLDKEDKESAAE